jgi:hypothetical protein
VAGTSPAKPHDISDADAASMSASPPSDEPAAGHADSHGATASRETASAPLPAETHEPAEPAAAVAGYSGPQETAPPGPNSHVPAAVHIVDDATDEIEAAPAAAKPKRKRNRKPGGAKDGSGGAGDGAIDGSGDKGKGRAGTRGERET